MRIKKEIPVKLNIDYDSLGLPEKEDVIFLDIETTGLSPRNSYIYMIGLCIYEEDAFSFTCLMAENASEEYQILNELNKVLTVRHSIVHFYGTTFDMPFIRERCRANGISLDSDAYNETDLFKLVKPCKKLFNLPNCKLQTIEAFLGTGRIDSCSGGELISVYKEYCVNHDEALYELLYRHNRDDVIGLLLILDIIPLMDIYSQPVRLKEEAINSYKDFYGTDRLELLIDFELASSLPSKVNMNNGHCFLSIKESQARIKVPIFHEVMKYYFDDYREYYYLPTEDTAIHKSVAAYVDKDHRTPASARTAYVKKEADFAPQWNPVAPVFKRDYDDKERFLEINDDFLNDDDKLSSYISELIKVLTESK